MQCTRLPDVRGLNLFHVTPRFVLSNMMSHAVWCHRLDLLHAMYISPEIVSHSVVSHAQCVTCCTNPHLEVIDFTKDAASEALTVHKLAPLGQGRAVGRHLSC